ncbi:ribonuclease P protein component [bacterium]|nr:ribonuclease P protein component [bacterium]
MLSKKYRLKKRSAFTATYRVKKSFYLEGVAVFVGFRKENTEEPTKIGFVVSKKTHKRAVKRNRLKRLMRENYRLFLKNNETGNANLYKSLIFVGHERALKLNFNRIKEVMRLLLEKIDD